MTVQYTQCRYLRRNGEQCTAEAVDDAPDAHIVLCSKHVAKVVQLVRERARAAATTTRR